MVTCYWGSPNFITKPFIVHLCTSKLSMRVFLQVALNYVLSFWPVHLSSVLIPLLCTYQPIKEEVNQHDFTQPKALFTCLLDAMAGLWNHSLQWVLACFSFCIISVTAELQRFEHPIKANGSLSLLVIGDWGRRGHYNQSLVADQVCS